MATLQHTSFQAFTKRHPVLTYYVLTFAISWGGLLMLVGLGGISGMMAQTTLRNSLFFSVVLVTLTGPILAGILLTIFMYGKQGIQDLVSRIFRWKLASRWYAIAVLAAPLSVFSTLFVLSLFSPAFTPGILTASDKVSILLPALVISLLGPLCEEVGWTGFAIPEVSKRYNIFATGLMVGILWGAWHFLSNLWGVGAAHGLVPVTLYVLVLLFSFLPPFRVLMVWVYDHTKSLLLAYIMHASLDFFFIISTPTGIAGLNLVTWYLVWAAVLWIVVAAVVVANGGKLSRGENTNVTGLQVGN